MSFAKRIFVFLAINVLVITSISILLAVLGVRPYLSAHGIDYSQLLAFCVVWGFGGAFISLAMSRIMAKWMMSVRVLDASSTALQRHERWLVDQVHLYARKAGLQKMPQVGIYESAEINAFATGPTKNRALVAVSSGLMNRMNENEIQGVLAHEVAHIANGDMVTMTLVQGVMNAFVMFVARAIAYAISLNVKEESRRMVNMLTTIVLEIALSVLAMFAVSWVSRLREYRADRGGADLAGRDKMIAALQALKRNAMLRTEAVASEPASIASFKISGGGRMIALLSTHPPLEKRIAALESGRP
jgi:heat shock protein HtpX